MFRELRRRRVFQTAAYYVVGTWLVLQVADVVFPALDISERAIRYILVGALLGFPAVLVLGWFYEIGAHGIRRTPPAGADELAAVRPLRRSDYLLLTALAVVAAAIIYNTAGRVTDEPAMESATAEPATEARRQGPPMVAVLPFTATSLGEESAFFASGVHDDLLTQLSLLESIRVISRTSVLEYKDVVRNIRQIGEELGADVILEGGVQSAGGNIRINAQLIDARTDAHLWAQTYDRQLSLENIFKVQAEIARAIASAMDATLTPQDNAQLSALPTRNMAAYRAYHEAMEISEREWSHQNEEYRAALEKAIELDPTFTHAMAELVVYLSQYNFYSVDDPGQTLLAEQTLERIGILAPGSVDHLYAQSYYTYYVLKDYELALELAMRAEQLRPSDADVLYLEMLLQRRIDWVGARQSLEKLRQLEPKEEEWVAGLIMNLVNSHEYDKAGQELATTNHLSYFIAWAHRLLELRDHGDFRRWAEDLVEIAEEFPSRYSQEFVWEGLVAARDFEAAVQSHADELQDSIDEADEIPITMVFSWWLAGKEKQLAEQLPGFRTLLENERDESGRFDDPYKNLVFAAISAIEGDRDETKRQIRQYFDVARADAVILAWSLQQACRILAIAELAAEAVDCIREGLEKPSSIHSFMEPHMPFYDPIRDAPEFIELLAELELSPN